MGIVFGLASSVSTAMHVVVIKQSLACVKNSVMDLAWYSNILTLIVIIPLIGVLESSKLVGFFFASSSSGGLGPEEWTRFWIGTVLTGLGGFLISIAGILSVKITSPITHMVSSAVRGVAQTALAIWFFGDILTVSKALSVSTILAGSIWYTWIKHVDSIAQRADLSMSDKYQRVPTEPKESTPDMAVIGVEFDADADADAEEIENMEEGRMMVENRRSSSSSSSSATLR